MKPRADLIIDLIHRAPFGVLATHSRVAEGFPFATALPFAPDEAHRPMLLISGLAEHTRNLLADPRASLLVLDSPEGDVLTGARATLVGRVLPAEPTPAQAQRYLRYHPQAADYLTLGDFRWFRLEVERVRAIAGFGAMGWVGAETLGAVAVLGAEDEAAVMTATPALPPDMELLGVDRFGVDLKQVGRRLRLPFAGAPVAADALAAALREALADRAEPQS
ncbi:MAG: pyridoxamine 5'-phosphate oxidase family protein [Betaproteobacteria bacterium]|nr:pyridoxamine 5'-phosphate oxidase family protein [Betaproteobacteria bacterium]